MKLYLLTLDKLAEAIGCDTGLVNEKIVTTILRGDEAESLREQPCEEKAKRWDEGDNVQTKRWREHLLAVEPLACSFVL